MTLTLGKDEIDAVLASIEKLTKSELLVGIPSVNTTRRPEPTPAPQAGQPPKPRKPQRVTNAMLGYVHNNGLPEKNLPARPWLEQGIEDARDAVAEILGAGVKRALDGDPDAARVALEAAGLEAVSIVRQRLNDGPWAPLAKRTIRSRVKRGRSGTILNDDKQLWKDPKIKDGSRILQDTGQMRNSITYVIRSRRS